MPRRSRSGTPVAGLAGLWLGLAVLALSTLPASAAEPAGVTLTTAAGPDGTWQVTAVVTDAVGAPVPEALVVFRARTAFGWLPLGARSTDATGQARIALPASVRTTEIRAEVGDDGQVRAILRAGRTSPATPRVRPGRDVLRALSPQPGVISPYPVPAQVALLAAVLGGIWATYGYVVWLLWRIRTSS